MLRGVHHYCNASVIESKIQVGINLNIYKNSIKNSKWFSSQVSRRLCQKKALDKAEAKSSAPVIKGIPYKQLSIGVPKEIWKNEKR